MDYRKRVIQFKPDEGDHTTSDGTVGTQYSANYAPRNYWFVDVESAVVTTQRGSLMLSALNDTNERLVVPTGHIHRKTWPTPEKARAHAHTKCAEYTTKAYCEHPRLERFELRDLPPSTDSTVDEPRAYELVDDPDHSWVDTFDRFAVPEIYGYLTGGPEHLWGQPKNPTQNASTLLSGELTEAQAERVAPWVYTLDVRRLAMTVDNLSGAIKPVVQRLVDAHSLPTLPEETPWWHHASSGFKNSRKLPRGITQNCVPPLVVGEHQLSSVQRMMFLRAALRDGASSPLYRTVIDHLSQASQEMTGIAAMRLWVASDSTQAYRWLLTIAADLVPHIATPLLEVKAMQWHSTNAFWAVSAASALVEINSQAGMEAAARIISEHRTRKVRDGARRELESYAARRGTSIEDILDQLVPRCGLSGDGTKQYCYGDRRFLAMVDDQGNLSARKVDDDGYPVGRKLTGLPKAGAADDATAVEKDRGEFRAMRRTVRQVTKQQLRRYEHLMIAGHEWEGDHFATHVAGHPILGRALVGLVWAVRHEGSERTLARIDDLRLVDIHDEPVAVTGAAVSIPYPTELSDSEIAEWSDVLTEYGLVAPFAQLDRATFGLPANQGDHVELRSLPNQDPANHQVRSLWDRYGWLEGDKAGGNEVERRLQFAGLGLPIFMEVSGIAPFESYSDDRVRVLKVVARPWDGEAKTQSANNGNRHKTRREARPWNEIPQRIVSEIRYQLDQLDRPANITA